MLCHHVFYQIYTLQIFSIVGLSFSSYRCLLNLTKYKLVLFFFSCPNYNSHFWYIIQEFFAFDFEKINIFFLTKQKRMYIEIPSSIVFAYAIKFLMCDGHG